MGGVPAPGAPGRDRERGEPPPGARRRPQARDRGAALARREPGATRSPAPHRVTRARAPRGRSGSAGVELAARRLESGWFPRPVSFPSASMSTWTAGSRLHRPRFPSRRRFSWESPPRSRARETTWSRRSGAPRTPPDRAPALLRPQRPGPRADRFFDCALLIGAALFVPSFRRSSAISPGFVVDEILDGAAPGGAPALHRAPRQSFLPRGGRTGDFLFPESRR